MRKLTLGLSLCLAVLLITSAVAVEAQGPDVDITLEPQSDGRLHFLVEVNQQFEGGFVGAPSGVTGGNVSVDMSSPSVGQLKIDVSGSVTIAEVSEQIDFYLSLLNVDMINNGIPESSFEGLKSFEGRNLSDLMSFINTFGGGVGGLPSGAISLEIVELRCTEFEWNDPELNVGLTTTLSGEVFENERITRELPISFDVSFDISDGSLTFELSGSGTRTEADLNVSLTTSDGTQTLSIALEGYTELPRSEGMVQWDLGEGSQTFLGSKHYEVLSSQLGRSDVTLTLNVPSDADVSGLPSGYQQDGNTYTWTDNDAANAVASIVTGEAETDISYEHEPTPAPLPWTWIGIGIAIVFIAIVVVLAYRRR